MKEAVSARVCWQVSNADSPKLRSLAQALRRGAAKGTGASPFGLPEPQDGVQDA